MEGNKIMTRSRKRLNLKPLSESNRNEWLQSKESKTDMERLLKAQEYKSIKESLKARMDESIINGFNTEIWSKTNESEKNF